jgi:hypothetical protein
MVAGIRSGGLVQGLLFAYAALVGINVGGALLASAVVFPAWSASPEAAMAWARPVDEARFFAVVSPVVLLLAVSVLVTAQFRGTALRRWMRWAGALYVLFFVITVGYFVPGQAALQGEAAAALAAPELAVALERWVRFNWLRQALGLATFGVALHTLGTAYRLRSSMEGAGRVVAPERTSLTAER